MTVALFGGFASYTTHNDGGLGYFSSNLNTLVNSLGWSAIFSQLPVYTNGQGEGFGYLGAGCLLLLIFAAAAWIWCKGKRSILKKHWKDMVALLAVVAVSMLFALSPMVSAGSTLLYSVSLPAFITELWSTFRSTGRVIWVVVYAVIILGCIIVLKKGAKREVLIMVCLCLALQVYDIHTPLAERHNRFSQKMEYESALQDDEFWDTVGADESIKHIVYVYSMEQEELLSLAEWALRNDKTVSDFYFARITTDGENTTQTQENLSAEDLFIYPSSDLLINQNSELYYYQSQDGYVVGRKEPIQGLTPIDKTEHSTMKWDFTDGLYVSEANTETTAEGVILYPEGFSYGPYCDLEKGTYQIRLEGTALPETSNVYIQSDLGKVLHEAASIEYTENALLLTLELEQDARDLEVAVRNDSSQPIALNALEISFVE